MRRLILLITICISSVSFGQTNNYSLEFDGNNFNANDGRVEFGNVNLGNNFTVCFWVKDSTHLNSSYFHELVHINGDFTTGFYSDTIFGVNISSGGNNSNWALAGANTDCPQTVSFFNNWSYFSILYNNDSLKVYINSQLESQYYAPGYTINGYLLLGDRNFNSSGNYNHNGKMDDVSLWDTVLTEQEIQDYMNCPPTGNESGLVGYWNFEEGGGSATIDQTINGNDGIINGDVTWSTDVPAYNCNIGISEFNSNQPKKLIKIVNLLGQEVEYTPNAVLIYQYSDGTSEKVFTIED